MPTDKHLAEYHILLPYLSPLLVREVLSAPQAAPVRHAFYQGSVLFVDIAGFSQISEALSRRGKIGAEEMTNILNRCFTQLLEIASAHDGQLVKFGGDALLLYFAGSDHAHRAAGCALCMQQAMQDFTVIATSQGDYPLAVHIGANSGSFYAASVGEPQKRQEYLFSGPDVSRAIQAEGLAAPGQVVVGSQMAALLGAQARLGPLEEGYSLLEDLEQTKARGKIDNSAPLDDTPSPDQIALLAGYLPSPLVERILAQLDGLEMLGEHRLVTALFINFYDLDVLLSQRSQLDLLEELQRYYVMVAQTVGYYGGVAARCDPTLHGDKLLLLFGAPISHENDAEHALRCALTLNARLTELKVRFRHRIGIATGYVFTGNVGSPGHREYTAMGNAANLAARLMAMADEGQILVSASTLYGLEERLYADPLAPIRVKGFSDPVQIYRVTGWRDTKKRSLQAFVSSNGLLARRAELAQLQAIMAQVQAGRRQIVAITGPAGIGKSTLIAAVARRWQEMGGSVYLGACEAFGEHIPYLPWAALCESFFDLRPTDTSQVRQGKILRQVSELTPEWRNQPYVLTDLLGEETPDQTLPTELSPRLRQQHLHSFVTALLRARAETQVLMVMLTDLHWSDRASLALLKHVARNTRDSRVLLLFSYRSGRFVRELEEVTELTLGRLPKRACRTLACRWLGGGAISDGLMAQLWIFSGGNPLYLKEMLAYLQSHNYLASDPAGRYILRGDPGTIPIPGSVEGMIVSTLDRLDEPSRQTIKSAAVVGRSFPLRVLRALSAQSPEHLQVTVDCLIDRELVYVDKPVSDTVYAFCEPQVREVTYDTLAFAQRRCLHRQLGHFFEREQRVDQPKRYALLAYHYDLGQEVVKAFEYHVKAGDQARKACANHEALHHYRRALEFLPQLSAPPQPRLLCQLYRDHGRVCRFLGLYQKALESYEQGLALARQNGDRSCETEILVWWSDLCHVQGDGQGTLEQAGRAAELAKEISNQTLLELSLEYLGGGHMLQGALDVALKYFELCLELSRGLENSQGVRRSLNNIGLIHVVRARYGNAIMAFKEALQLARDMQDSFYTVILANNLGELYQELYATALALPLHEEALSMARQFGIKDFQCDSLRNLAVDLAQSGARSQALDYLNRARSLAREAGFVVGEASVLYDLGRTWVEDGAEDEAATAAQELMSLAEKLGIGLLQQKAWLLTGLVHQMQGRWSEAETALQTTTELWEREPMGPLGWQSYQALGELTSRQGRFDQAEAAFARARQIQADILVGIRDQELRASFSSAVEASWMPVPAPSAESVVNECSATEWSGSE